MNKKWSELSHLQIGRYGEYFVKMVLSSYGLDIYTSEVDDHGIDFVVKNKNRKFFEIQVKSIRQNTGYVFVTKEKWNIESENLYLALVLFVENKEPELYLIPAPEWKKPNDLLRDRDYKGKKSKPEYGINISKKNRPILKEYAFKSMIHKIIEDERIKIGGNDEISK